MLSFGTSLLGGYGNILTKQAQVENNFWTREFYATSEQGYSNGNFVARQSVNGRSWYEVFVNHKEKRGPGVIADSLAGKYANWDSAVTALQRYTDVTLTRLRRNTC